MLIRIREQNVDGPERTDLIRGIINP